VSKKWAIIMDKRQDKNVASTQAETSGPLAQQWHGLRRRREEIAWNRRRIQTHQVVVMFLLSVMTYVASYELFWNCIGFVQFVSHGF